MDGPYNGGFAELQRFVKPLLERYGVHLYLCGHLHNLQHLNVDGVHYFVSGAGSRLEVSCCPFTSALFSLFLCLVSHLNPTYTQIKRLILIFTVLPCFVAAGQRAKEALELVRVAVLCRAARLPVGERLARHAHVLISQCRRRRAL